MSSVKEQLITTLKLLPLIGRILLMFVASLAPLMFLVGVIAGLDRYGQHRQLLENLQAYGIETDAVISYIDEENFRNGVDFLRSDGSPGFASIDWRYYPPDVYQSLKYGQTIRIVYIDALVSGWDRAVLADHYQAVKAYPRIPPDIWWILGISLLLIVFNPQFVFLGMVDFNELLSPSFEK
ncbi:MAG: hypothetical protein CVU44_19540 [Chloroflexi bacterium HGW-Chloroflexi-6]|nr:MAG: hypothetical protein CVU44_19540 [Chloroflexi bacterium HGW-Chloroflexi-6]